MFAAQWDGSGRPLVENDAVNVTAYVRIYKDPTGVLWHSFEKSATPPKDVEHADILPVTIQKKRQAW